MNVIDLLLFPADIPEDKAGPLTFRQSSTINTFKGLTPVVILLFIYLYSHEPFNAHLNPVAWMYFGVHGSYGLLWVGKDLAGFGDKRFASLKPFWFTLVNVCALSLYWLPIFIIVNETDSQNRTPLYICGISIMIYAVGVFWHFVSDIHKTVFLEYRQFNSKSPKLLQTKLWSLSRNPNYFGELLIYSSFCLLAWNWIPFVWVFLMVTLYWVPSMLKKEKSLSRFGKSWEEYRDNSYFFIPYLY